MDNQNNSKEVLQVTADISRRFFEERNKIITA